MPFASSHTVELPAVRLLAVVELQSALARDRCPPDEVMSLVVDSATEATGAASAVVELAEGDEMVQRAVSGQALPHLGRRLPAAASLSGRCVREGRAVRCDDARTAPLADREACLAVGAASLLCVPLHWGDEVFGALTVLSDRPGAFEDDDVALLALLGDVIAVHLEAAREVERRATESRYDPLTRLGNRRAYDERVLREVARAQRYDHDLSLLVVGLDGLSAVDQVEGPGAVDEVVRRVASLLRDLRMTDEVFSLGAGEFGIILPESSSDGARLVADRLAAGIAEASLSAGRITAGVGMATRTWHDARGLHAAAEFDRLG